MRDEDWTDFGFGISDFGFCDLSTERRSEASGSIPLTQNPKSQIRSLFIFIPHPSSVVLSLVAVPLFARPAKPQLHLRRPF
jgi:hypothetical protein